jgi:hypothetical protein
METQYAIVLGILYAAVPRAVHKEKCADADNSMRDEES